MSDLFEAYTSAQAYASAHDTPEGQSILQHVLDLQQNEQADPAERLAALKAALAKIEKRRGLPAASVAA